MTNHNFALARLDWPEGPLIEKKTEKDHSDWPKTLVAFANSTVENERAILFIGASNQKPHKGISSPRQVDDIQRRISDMANDKCYPPIRVEFVHLVLTQAGKDCHLLAVIVPASNTRPHFAGAAYIRDGSKSRPASKEIYKDLVTSHNETAGRLLAWKDKQLQMKIVSDGKLYFWTNATILGCSGTSVQIRDDTTSFWEAIPLSQVEFSDRGSLPPVVTVKYWRTDKELVELMISRWNTFISTAQPIYHAQVEYVQKQAELHPELFEPVMAYMVAAGNTSPAINALHSDLRSRLGKKPEITVQGSKHLHKILKKTGIS